MHYFSIGDCTIFHADCMDVLPELSPVNMILSDLPYPLESGGNTTGEMGGKFSKGEYDNSGSIIPCDIEFSDYMPLLANVLPQGHAYFMVNNRHVAAVQNAALASGFRFHNLLVWDKSTGTPNRWYMKNCEFTLFAFRGLAKPINDCGSRQLIKCPNVINGVHETQKPVALMEGYIRNSSNSGDVVLDPFMGSGTTGVACINLGRKFVGIEKERRYFDIAVDRLRDAYSRPNMFSEAVA